MNRLTDIKYVDEVTREHFVKIRDQLIQDGLKPQTVNKKMCPFKKMMRLAVEEWEVSEPIKTLKALKFTTKKRRVLEHSEEKIILKLFDDIIHEGFVPEGYKYKKLASVKAYREMFIVYLESGIRLSELTSMKKDDIYWLGHYMTIADPKINDSRDVPMTRRCEDALRELVKRYPGPKSCADKRGYRFCQHEPVFQRCRLKESDSPLFASHLYYAMYCRWRSHDGCQRAGRA